MKIKSIFLIPLALGVGILSAQAADAPNLLKTFEGREVRILVMEIKNSSSEPSLDMSLMKQEIQDALSERKSIHFKNVSDPEAADLAVETDIREYHWSDHDPVDMLMGVSSAAMDAASVEDYAELHAEVTVTDVKKNRVLWKDRIRSAITKKPMSKIESVPLLAKAFSKDFIKQCFGKKSR